MKVTNNYMGRVLNTLGVQAARNMKAKHRALVSIKDLASALKAFKNKSELNQLTSSVNHLIKMGLVELVLPECVNKSLKQVGLGGIPMLCGGACGSCGCRPRLSVGVVYPS
ncbi:hypothetical protein WDU94_004229 [Cyamophila willieti]